MHGTMNIKYILRRLDEDRRKRGTTRVRTADLEAEKRNYEFNNISRKHSIKHPSSKARHAGKATLKKIFEESGMKLLVLIQSFKSKYKGGLFLMMVIELSGFSLFTG